MIDLLAMAVCLVFAAFWKSVATQYSAALDYTKAKNLTEQQMAAAFIRVAIKQYEARNTRPDMLNPAEFEQVCNQQDDLVEQYYLMLETNRKEVAKGVMWGIKKEA